MQRHKKIAMSLVVTVCLGGLAYAIALKANPEDDTVAASSVTPDDTGAAVIADGPATGPRMDIAFVIDATGSMGDEIDNIKAEVWSIAQKMASGKPKPDVRFSLVLYKDKGDDFIAKATPFTRDVAEIKSQLDAIIAHGGGDNPEDVGRGLHTALDLEWDAKAAVRSIYLVGDAPSQHYDDQFSVEAAVKRANDARIAIHSIGCSGLNDLGKDEFAMVAKRTQGTYESLTYQAIVTDDDGTKKSIIVYDGKTYEAEGVIGKNDWGRGGGGLIKSGKLKPARSKMRRKAKKKVFFNNLGSSVKFQMVDDAVKNEVTF